MSEPIPPNPTGPRPPSMREQWAELISTPHSPRRWAVIAAAITTADAAPVDRFGEPLQRGDEAWCRVAITALESPTSAAAARELPDALPRRCFADLGLLRAWLNAPVGYREPDRTIADGLDLVDWSTASHEAIHRAVLKLVDQAQSDGVFGVNGHHIEIHRLVDVDDWHAGYLLVARPAFGPGLTADELETDELIPTQEQSPVDGAVRVLSNVAAVVDAVLDSRDASQAAAPPVLAHGRGHPFRAGTTPQGPPPSRRPRGR